MFTEAQVRKIFAELSVEEVSRKHTRVQIEEMYHATLGGYPSNNGKKIGIVKEIAAYFAAKYCDI